MDAQELLTACQAATMCLLVKLLLQHPQTPLSSHPPGAVTAKRARHQAGQAAGAEITFAAGMGQLWLAPRCWPVVQLSVEEAGRAGG